MADFERFPFTEKQDVFGITDAVPQLPLILIRGNTSVKITGILDTGASVNVLPYSIGKQLGAIWEEQMTSVMLAGNLAPVEAKGLVISARIGSFSPVRLVFAWSKSNDLPLLLGRMNFFLEFNVCFFGSQKVFEISPKV
ncbi:retroviral-like aspartic protease [Pleurocapsales cyanobacterium LEGE 06147]|nr:retroviral-like aspartic protease [Pleurocapsales cyanobacterium LEGE 06147]